MSSPSWDEYRASFPMFGSRRYFASQALGPVPGSAWDDFEAFRRSLSLGSRAIPEWIGRLLELGSLGEELLCAPPGSVAVLPSATAAQAAVAACIQPTSARPRIVVDTLAFHSSRYLWAAQVARGFELVEVPAASDGVSMDTAAIVRAIDERVAAVALPLVSPITGAILDVVPIAAAARDAGALLIIDAYQAAGILPIDATQSGADVIVVGTHKWLSSGDMGVAFLYVRESLANQLNPAYPGWIGHADMASFSTTFVPAHGARRFQQGSPAMGPIYLARAGLRLALDTGVATLRERSVLLTARLLARAQERGLRISTPLDPSARGPFVVFQVPDPPAILRILEAQGFDVDARPNAGLRVGPHPAATLEECDLIADAIAQALHQQSTPA